MEFEDMLAQRLREQEHAMTLRMQKELQNKDANVQQLLQQALSVQQQEHEQDQKVFAEKTRAAIQSDFDQLYGSQMNSYKEEMAAELQSKISMLEQLMAKVEQLQTALATSETTNKGSKEAHRLSAAALALTEKLEANHDATREIEALQAVAGPNSVIRTAVATIPPTAIPTISQLQTMFETVHRKCRQAALVPPGRAGLEGQLIGKLFAAIKYAPQPTELATANGDTSTAVAIADPPSGVTAEHILVQSHQFVKLGQLEEAISCLDQLTKNDSQNYRQVVLTVADWREQALHRIAVDKALKVIKLECALLNESLG
jgi:Mitochondrial inner membrane protein